MAYGLTNVLGITSAEMKELEQILNDLNELIGGASNTGGTATAGTIMAKLNKLLTDWTTTRAGYLDAINTNAGRLTSTRAGYLDKLANLGAVGDTGGTATAGTIMAKLNKLLTDWSAARAGYLDNINTNASNLASRLTSTRAGYLDKLANFGAVNDTGGTSTAGSIMAKLNKLLTDWTSTRAGYIDKLANFGTTGETGGSATAGTMMAKLNKLLTDWTSTRAGYINTINTNTARLTSTRAGYIDKLSNFGATGDTGGSATAGTMMGKINKLISDNANSGLKVKSVQSGLVYKTTINQTTIGTPPAPLREIKINTINASKSIFYLQPYPGVVGNSYGSGAKWGVCRLYNEKLTQEHYYTTSGSSTYSTDYIFNAFTYAIIEFE